MMKVYVSRRLQILRRKIDVMICVWSMLGGSNSEKYTLMNAKQRFLVLMSLILLLVFLIILRLFWLQVVNSEHLSRLADEQISSSEFKHTPRGKIVDRNGEELAVSIMTSSLYVDPEELQKDNAEDKQLPKRDAPKLLQIYWHLF